VYDLRKSETVDVDNMLSALINCIEEPKGTRKANELFEEMFDVADSVLHPPVPLSPTGGVAADSMFTTTSLNNYQLQQMRARRL
jgi:hypothetical protein